MNHKRIKNLIGLELSGRRLAAVQMRRAGAGGRLEVVRTAQVALTLDPLAAAPELAAREIRDRLQEAGLRARHCTVCLPLGRVLVHQVALPALDEADLQTFLDLEIENAFPFAPEDLAISTTRFTDPAGARWATVAAVSLSHIEALDKVLRLAGLRPVSVTLGATALLAGADGVEAAFGATEAGVEFVVATGGGPATLRQLGEPHPAAERAGEILDGPELARECRITLGRLGRPIREGLRRARVFGVPALRRELIDALRIELEVLGIELEAAGVDDQGRIAPAGADATPAAVTLATALWLRQGRGAFEFLTPRAGRIAQMTRRLMARGVLWRLGGAAAFVVLLVALALGWQHWQLSRLERRWSQMEAAVTELTALQDKIREDRPWFDDQVPSLEVARRLTETFPEQGLVWTRSIEIKDVMEQDGLKAVNCSGYAKSNADWLAMLDALRKTPGVENLQVIQSRGDDPVQFSLSYLWNMGRMGGSDGE